MTQQVYQIELYAFLPNEAVFFDANIWMYIYGPMSNISRRYKIPYSLASKRIFLAKGLIYIDVLVLSEFINSYARLVYNTLPSATKPAEFKSFRNSGNFQRVAEEIVTKCRQILRKCERTETGFESLDLLALLMDYTAGNADFNDQMLAQLCRTKGLILVTHDADFKGENLTILTANPKLLS